MRNRILKAPLVAVTGLLAMAAIPAVAQAGGGTYPTPDPAISLDKTGAATANAGDTFTYSFAVTNTGNVTLTNVELTDDKCQDTLTRDPAETDDAFDPADVWHYTCTVVAPAGPAEVHNAATVTAKWSYQCKTKTVEATDDHTFTVPPPVTPPVNPPVNPPVTRPRPAGDAARDPPATPPAGGGVLPEQVISGRAALRGPSGCVKQAFRARVNGRQHRFGDVLHGRQAREAGDVRQCVAPDRPEADRLRPPPRRGPGPLHRGERDPCPPPAAHVPALRAPGREPAVHRLSARHIRGGPEAPSDRGLRRP